MAADANKKSTSSEESDKTVTSESKTNGDSQAKGPRKLSPRSSDKKQILAVLAIIVVVAISAWFVFGVRHVGQKVYAQAAGHKIYKQDVKNLVGNTKGVSDHQAATVLANKYLLQAMAKEQGVTVTDKDVEAVSGLSAAGLSSLKTMSKYSYQAQVNSAYSNKLSNQYQGVYKGYVLVAHFSRYIPDQPVTPQLHAAIPQMGDAGAIASDKKYAQDFINNLYDQIKAHKITWDQAAQMEINDPTIGTNMYPALSHSGPFDTAKAEQPLFIAPSAQAKVSTLKDGQVTKPFVVSVYNPSTGQNFESYFLVVRMDSTSGGHATGSFSQYLTQSKKRLDYKVNV